MIIVALVGTPFLLMAINAVASALSRDEEEDELFI